jgi:hypothetical protein
VVRAGTSISSSISNGCAIVDPLSEARPAYRTAAGQEGTTARGVRPERENLIDAVLAMVTVEEIRALAMSLPRTTEALVRDRVKFRVGRIVYLALSPDETILGFAFHKDEREALVRSEPDKFLMPERADLRYHWVQVRLAAIDAVEMRELVLDAWRMVVPKRVAADYEATR